MIFSEYERPNYSSAHKQKSVLLPELLLSVLIPCSSARQIGLSPLSATQEQFQRGVRLWRQTFVSDISLLPRIMTLPPACTANFYVFCFLFLWYKYDMEFFFLMTRRWLLATLSVQTCLPRSRRTTLMQQDQQVTMMTGSPCRV